MLLLRLSLLLCILIPLRAAAQPPANCDCLWQGSFSRVITHADFILLGEVTGQKGNSTDIAVIQRYFYNSDHPKEFNDTVRLWTDNGKLCRPKSSTFPIGSRWIMAMKKIVDVPADGFDPNTPNISYGREGDYYLSSCGAYWLQEHDGFVTGNLTGSQRWSWETPEMNPVLVELVKAYIEGVLPEQALIEAAKPDTESKRLMEETKNFLRLQSQ